MLRAKLLGLASAIIVATPFVVQQSANADYWNNNDWYGHGWNGNRGWYGSNLGWNGGDIDRREQIFLNQLERGRESGRLTANEYQQLQRRFNRLEDIEAQYRAGGLAPWERQDLQERMNRLNAFLQQELNDNQNAWEYDNNNRYAGRWNPWY